LASVPSIASLSDKIYFQNSLNDMAPSVYLTQDTLDALEASLLNTSGSAALHDRFRALFTLKAAQEQEKVIEIIGKGVFVYFTSPSRSSSSIATPRSQS